MARWDDEFRDHPARSAFGQLETALESAPTPETPDDLDELERIRQIHGAVLEALNGTDAALLRDREGTLNTIQQQSQAAAKQITAYSSSKDPQHITNAIPAVEALLPPLAVLRSAVMKPTASVAEDATRYRQQTGQLVRHLKDEASDARNDVDALRTKVKKVEDRLAALDSELDSRTSQWEQASSEFRSQQTASIDQFRTQQEQKFTETHDRLTNNLQQMEADYREKAESLASEWAERRNELDSSAKETVDGLTGLLEDAEELAGRIAETGLAGRYLSFSKEEGRAALVWYAVAFVLALGLVGGAAWFLFIHRPADLSFGESIRRAVFVLIASAPPVYAFREASGHRTNARTYRRLYIELASFSLYLADLDAESIKDKKLDRIEHYFPGRSLSDERPGSPSPYRGGLFGINRRRASGEGTKD
jgi:hypothetical protein